MDTAPGSAAGTQTFAYRAQTTNDRPVSGTIDALDHAEAPRLLEAMRLRVVDITAARSAVVRRAPGSAEFLAFNQQLAYLTRGGLPVEAGLRLIARETRSRRMARAIEQIAAEAEAGKPLGQAFDNQRQAFPPLYGRLIDAGVRAGNLPGVLFNLGQHMELVQRLQSVLWQSLSYPVAVLVGMVLLLLVLGTFVLPMFTQIFVDFNTSLPLLTQWVLGAAHWMPWALGVAVALVVVLPLLWAALLPVRPALVDAFFMPMPLLGPVLRASRNARWCDALRLGVQAGMDLPQAIALACDVIGSPAVRRDGRRLIAALEAGSRLDQVRGLSVLSEAVVAAIELASAAPATSGRAAREGTGGTGDLAATLANLAAMSQQQAESRLRLLDVVLTPVVLVVLALVMGVVILAMFLPLVKLISNLT